MKRRSFRFRLALISMGLSGLVLLVFGIVAWWAISRARIHDLDQELANFGYRFASRAGPGVSPDRQEETLVSLVGADVARYRFFAILNRHSEPVARSQRWPDLLDPTQYPSGETLLDPQPDVSPAFPRQADPRPGQKSRSIYRPEFYTVARAGQRYRLGSFRNDDVILVSGADLDQFSRETDQLRNAFLLAIPAALAMIAFGAWLLGCKALRPVRLLERDMETLSARDLGQRLEPGKADIEFARIIATYNTMLERLERNFHHAIRFSGDVSHELKTPMAVTRATLERALSQCRDVSEAREVFSQLLEQTGLQNAILESLLLLSRADAGKLEISSEAIDLSRSLETWLEDAELLAEGRGVTLHSDIEPGISFSGDPVLLQQVAHNLYSNAVRYNHDGGRIESRLCRTEEGIDWTIANTGEPISREDRTRIFERFERVSESGGRYCMDGAGLGLSLVKEIVTAHGGTVTVDENAEGWTEFRVRLPK